MKWFKHKSSARNDEKIAKLEDLAGLEGYGFYFKLLEIVAELMDTSDQVRVEYSTRRWAGQTNITVKKFNFLTQCCADVGLISVQTSGEVVAISIPNLLNHRDNHTKNLQVTCKQPESNLLLDKDKEKDIDKSKTQTKTNTPHNPPRGQDGIKKKSVSLPEWLDPDDMTAFAQHRAKLKKPMTDRGKELFIAELSKLRDEGQDPKAVIEQSIFRGWQGVFPVKHDPNRPSAEPEWTENDQWRMRMRNFMTKGLWVPEAYGARPWEKGCIVPDAVLSEFKESTPSHKSEPASAV